MGNVKICTKCQLPKELTQFYNDNRRRNGLMSACKECHILYNKNQKEYKANWYQKNKERLKPIQNKYNKLYRTQIKPWFRAFDKAKQRCNNPKDDSYKYYGGRGIKFLMMVKDFETLWFRDKAYLMNKPSIDRKNPDKNYIIDNCRYIEFEFNVARRRKRNYERNNHK